MKKLFACFLALILMSAQVFAADPSPSYNVVTIKGGQKANLTNPAINGWGISFSLPDQPGYNNGSVQNVYLDGSATFPTNGMLLNTIVKPGYCQQIGGTNCASPVVVGANIELQVQSGSGYDYWANLGVLDIQTATGAGGQATSGIVRGQWTGTCICVGLLSQAENYTGRAFAGVMVGASLSGSTGAYFDNAYSVGVVIHHAKDIGIQVGGLLGGGAAQLPTIPYAFYNANQTASLWQIANAGGVSANETIIGSSTIISPASGFASLQFSNTNAVLNNKNWQFIGGSDGSMTLRTINDALSSAVDIMKFARSGTAAAGVQILTTLNATSYLAASTPGVSCSGAPTSSFAAVGGIVTHC